MSTLPALFSPARLIALAALLLACGCPNGPHENDGGSGGSGGGNHPPAAELDVNASTVTLTPPGPLLADGNVTSLVTVTLKTTTGQPMTGTGISVALSGDGGFVTMPGGTNADGVASASISSTLAETKTVTVTVNTTPPVTLTQAPQITFTPGPATGIAFGTQPPATVKAGQIITPAVTLVTLDAHGNVSSSPAIAASLRLVRSNGGVVSGGQAKDSVDGGIVFDMLSVNRPQTGYALRAEVASGPAAGAADESHLFDVTLGDPSALTSTLLAAPVNVAADGTSTSTVTFTLLDVATNPLPGVPVSFSVTGSNNSVGSPGGVTDAFGAVSTTLSSTTAEVKTVTADAGTFAMSAPVTFF